MGFANTVAERRSSIVVQLLHVKQGNELRENLLREFGFDLLMNQKSRRRGDGGFVFLFRTGWFRFGMSKGSKEMQQRR